MALFKVKKTSYGYGKHIVERLENSLTGSVEEGIKQRYQNWGVYHEVIAVGKLYQSKSQTVYLEQNLIRYTLFVKTSKVKRIGEHDN